MTDQYFTQPTCKILEEKGVVGESKYVWIEGRYNIRPIHIVSAVDEVKVDIETLVQAYTLLDIFNPNNAKKVFGEDWVCPIDGVSQNDKEILSKCVHAGRIGIEWKKRYKYCCHLLLNTMLSGGDVEAELIKLLEQL